MSQRTYRFPSNTRQKRVWRKKTLNIGSGRLQGAIAHKISVHELDIKLQHLGIQANQDHQRLDLTKIQLLDLRTLCERFASGSLSVSSLMEYKDLTPSELVYGIKIIYMVLQHGSKSLVNKIMQQLVFCKPSFFIVVSLLLGKQMALQKYDGDDTVIDMIIHLLHELNEVFPVQAFEMMEVIFPQLENLLCCGPPEINKPNLHECIKQWNDRKKTYVASVIGSGQNDKCLPETHCLPPNDFHWLPLIPDRDEILSTSEPFLRPCIVDGAYEDVDEYLDIHFRLLREDLFRDFRKCLNEYFEGDIQSGIIYFNAHVEDIQCGHKDMLWTFFVPVISDIDWESTKRLLPGSLICVSSDNFAHFAFAYIDSRLPSQGVNNACFLHLSFFDQDHREINVNFWDSYDIIETSAYYEAHKYVLERLKKTKLLASFPLGKCLLNFKRCTANPSHAKKKAEDETLQNSIAKEIGDEQQCAAFRMALENKVALIQGPPGTGKSYIGMQLAKCLIKDGSVKKPIILLSYTNHALDQFCENILPITDKIVRIGGRSRNPLLDSHNLQAISHSINLFRNWKSKELVNPYWLLDMFNIDDVDEFINGFMDIDIINSCLATCEESIRPIVMESKIFQSFEDFCDALMTAGNILGCNMITKENPPYFTERDIFRSVLAMVNSCSYPFVDNSICNTLFGGNIWKQLYSFRKPSHTYPAEEIVHRWLCLTPLYSDVYLHMGEFRQHLVTTMLICIESGLNLKKKEEVKDYLVSLLQKLCDYDIVLKVRQKGRKQRLFHDRSHYETSLCDYINNRMSTSAIFRLLYRSAVYCCKSFAVEKLHKNVWQYDIFQRWNLLNCKLRSYFTSKLNGRRLWISDEQSNSLQSCRSDFLSCISQRGALQDVNYCKILSHADVIAMTTSGCTKHSSLIESLEPTTFIVEEAAQVLESHIVMSLATSTDHLILIGDHLQLKPSPNVYDLAVKYKLDVSLFERLFKNGAPSVALKMQHRMRPCISQLLVPEFYSELTNHPSVEKYKDIKGVALNMFFLQHAEYEEENEQLKSHSNLHEAEFIVSLCKFLISQGNAPSEITILTTYVGQLRVIKTLLERKSINVQSTTVDNFQGEENDIILLSFVRSNKESCPGFIKISNRICVALSRAKRAMFCIGNFQMFAEHSRVWVSLINKMKKMNCFGEKLHICCSNHPSYEQAVESSEDLEQFMRNECKAVCGAELKCDHTCTSLCHFGSSHYCRTCDKEHVTYEKDLDLHDDDGSFIMCVELATTESNSNVLNAIGEKDEATHPNTLVDEISYGNKAMCFPKHAPDDQMGNTTAECLIDVSAATNAIDDSTVCMQEKNRKFIFDHYEGSEVLNGFKWDSTNNTVTTVMKCGKKVAHTIGEKPSHPDCEYFISLPCEHKISCSMYKDDYLCTELITVNMPCGHSVEAKCCDKSNVQCDQLVTQNLYCGHEIRIACSKIDCLENIDCEESMLVTLPCGHAIKAKCWEKCDVSCEQRVTQSLPCGHEITIPCSMTNYVENIVCEENVTVTLPCDHQLKLLCRDRNKSGIVCKVKCDAVLPCGHLCIGNCDKCKHGHVECKFKVSVLLECGHSCFVVCGEKPTLCTERCEFRCEHLHCYNPCCVPCIECSQPCSWSCEHFRCTQSCGELCDRPPCNQQCPEFFSCGHQCACFCGEPCPPTCPRCTGSTDSSGLVLLVDCGHVLCENILTEVLETKTLPKCPICGELIRINRRFGNLLKNYLKEKHIETRNDLKSYLNFYDTQEA